MTNEEYVKRLGILYNKVLSLRKDEDYVINQPQMDKLVKVLEFFIDESKRLDGTVLPTVLSPREGHGGVVAKFPVFDIHGDKIARFCEAMSGCSAIGAEPTSDNQVCIDCTIPDVFVPKNERV